MKYHFNENNLVAGYIKELLRTFPLPTCQVFIPGQTELYPNTHYIYKNELILTNSNITDNTYVLDQNSYKYIQSYRLGQSILNITKTLKMKSIYYDTYTHEYLGNFLRFYRDYTGVDLMMLYNCFSDHLVDNLYYHYNVETKTGFNTQDTNFKVYAVPVKFNRKYLIGLDCDTPVEVACGLFDGETQVTAINTDALYSETYQRITRIGFTNPVEFSTQLQVDQALKSYEPCLCLFLKLPANNTSSISIIEVVGSSGQFRQAVDGTIASVRISKESGEIEYPSKLSLFKMNDTVSYPFADRLLEYLFGSAITSQEIIGDNIGRVQQQLLSGKQMQQNGVRLPDYKYYGVWSPGIRTTCYGAAQRVKRGNRFVDRVYDITGYVDKDIEQLITVVND